MPFCIRRGARRASSGTLIAALLLLTLAASVAPAPAGAQILPSLGGERAGTSGFQFLKIPVDPRGAALGQTAVATAKDAGAIFWNPALGAQLDGLHVSLQRASYFVDIQMAGASAVYRLPGSSFSLGFGVQTLDSGAMDVTTEFQPFGTGETFALRDLALGLTASQRLTDLFSYGITAKYVRESVAGLTNSTYVFDLGVFYRVGATGAQMGVAVRNFGLDGTPSGELERTIIGDTPTTLETDFERTTPPTTFMLGLAYDVLRNSSEHAATISAQLNNPADNAETWNMGIEYGWQSTLWLRAGFRLGVEEATAPSLGAGLAIPGITPALRADYGFNRLERLGNVHRLGLNISL
ncbi:MAG: PorV/PorQ family protein [Rhodothermales bacterium]|nr:PorV/PorQ family protein [Rhodothermales bacterium]